MKSLWKELLNPTPLIPENVEREDFDRAWNWIFERDSLGNYCRAMITLKIVRNHAKDLKRRWFHANCAEIAAVGVWMRLKEEKARNVIPTRKTEIKQDSVRIPRRGI